MGIEKTLTDEEKLTVIKSLNNNMVLVRDSAGLERICQGKGIGFQKRSGDKIARSLVERSYIPENELKAAADYVTAGVDEDGLYKAFEYLGLI